MVMIRRWDTTDSQLSPTLKHKITHKLNKKRFLRFTLNSKQLTRLSNVANPFCFLFQVTQLVDFLDKIHTLDPQKRPTVNACLSHPFIVDKL